MHRRGLQSHRSAGICTKTQQQLCTSQRKWQPSILAGQMGLCSGTYHSLSPSLHPASRSPVPRPASQTPQPCPAAQAGAVQSSASGPAPRSSDVQLSLLQTKPSTHLGIQHRQRKNSETQQCFLSDIDLFSGKVSPLKRRRSSVSVPSAPNSKPTSGISHSGTGFSYQHPLRLLLDKQISTGHNFTVRAISNVSLPGTMQTLSLLQTGNNAGDQI